MGDNFNIQKVVQNINTIKWNWQESLYALFQIMFRASVALIVLFIITGLTVTSIYVSGGDYKEALNEFFYWFFLVASIIILFSLLVFTYRVFTGLYKELLTNIVDEYHWNLTEENIELIANILYASTFSLNSIVFVEPWIATGNFFSFFNKGWNIFGWIIVLIFLLLQLPSLIMMVLVSLVFARFLYITGYVSMKKLLATSEEKRTHLIIKGISLYTLISPVLGLIAWLFNRGSDNSPNIITVFITIISIIILYGWELWTNFVEYTHDAATNQTSIIGIKLPEESNEISKSDFGTFFYFILFLGSLLSLTYQFLKSVFTTFIQTNSSHRDFLLFIREQYIQFGTYLYVPIPIVNVVWNYIANLVLNISAFYIVSVFTVFWLINFIGFIFLYFGAFNALDESK